MGSILSVAALVEEVGVRKEGDRTTAGPGGFGGYQKTFVDELNFEIAAWQI